MESVFRRMIRAQVIVTIVVALAAGVLSGLNAGVSAMAGGIAAIAGGLAGARVASGSKNHQDAGSVLVRLLKAEAVKIMVIVLLLLLVFKFYGGLVPLALIFGLAGAALLSGAAIFSINEKSNL